MEGECSISLVEEEEPFRYNINEQGYCVVVYADFKIYNKEEESSRRVCYVVPCMQCDEEASDDLWEVLCDLVEEYELPSNMFSDIYEALESGYMILAANCRGLGADRFAPRATVHIRGGGASRHSVEAVLQPCVGGFVCSICLEKAGETCDAKSEECAC